MTVKRSAEAADGPRKEKSLGHAICRPICIKCIKSINDAAAEVTAAARKLCQSDSLEGFYMKK